MGLVGEDMKWWYITWSNYWTNQTNPYLPTYYTTKPPWTSTHLYQLLSLIKNNESLHNGSFLTACTFTNIFTTKQGNNPSLSHKQSYCWHFVRDLGVRWRGRRFGGGEREESRGQKKPHAKGGEQVKKVGSHRRMEAELRRCVFLWTLYYHVGVCKCYISGCWDYNYWFIESLVFNTK